MINDTSGNLLFYSNGIYMANSNHDTLLNSTNFNPGYATAVGNTFGLNLTQSLLIFPFSENSEFYAVIHCSAERFYDGTIYQLQPIHLSYSVVDITLDQGLGGIC